MTSVIARHGVRAVVLDIEGTSSPISFVHDVLFPFARAHLIGYLAAASPGTVDDLAARFAAEHAADIDRGERPPRWSAEDRASLLTSMTAYALWLMDRDRKSPALKELQGHIWDQGYREGRLRGEVFPDVAPAIRRWHAAQIGVAIYSSGSALAQRLLFSTTADGDLTPLIGSFFDTAVGPKMSAASYRMIAEALGLSPSNLLFVSDVTAELRAARDAGFAVLLSIRPGNALQPDASSYESITSFDEIG